MTREKSKCSRLLDSAYQRNKSTGINRIVCRTNKTNRGLTDAIYTPKQPLHDNKMNKLNLVKLKNDNYKSHNLTKDMRGIVLKTNYDNADVLFFNPNNVGDHAVVNIKNEDLESDKEKLPAELEKELLSASDNIKSKAKDVLAAIAINEYDMVELLVEEERYAKFGAHKGDVGCVMDSNAVQNYIEVDFSGIDKKGNYYGDCISVKIDDLKLIK